MTRLHQSRHVYSVTLYTSVCWRASLLILFVLAPPTYAYREIAVEDGGSISGQVVFDGQVLPPATLPVHKNRAVCGESMPDESLLLDAHGGLRNVVVILDGIHAGKGHPALPALLDNKNCAFVPRVQTIAVGQPLELRNSDFILHNVHARQNGHKTIFNLGLPYWSEKTYRFTQPGHVLIDCDVLHTWMRAHIIVTDHPYTAVTDAAGRFDISHIPPGEYGLRLWHERLGEQTRSVSVRTTQETRVRLTYTVRAQRDKGH